MRITSAVESKRWTGRSTQYDSRNRLPVRRSWCCDGGATCRKQKGLHSFQALNRFAKQSVDAHLALGISTILKSSTRVALSVISRVKVLPFLLVCPRILYLNFNIFIFL